MEETTPQTMSAAECWQALREHEFARLAFHVLGEVHITPLNYAVSGESLLFRTAQGTKLLGVVMDAPVALEVDELSEDSAWSVVVRGRARVLEGDEASRPDSVPLRPWVGRDKDVVVEITPSEVSGRRFHLSRPWEHMVPHEEL